MGINKDPKPALLPLFPPHLFHSQPDGAMIELSEGQKRIMAAVENGKNVFFTGPAGSGKSALINHIREKLGASVTASTGMAASLIGGVTIHSFTGIGINFNKSIDYIMGAVMNSDKALFNIKEAERLVIDEVSMLTGGMLDVIHEVFCRVRQSKEVFGGVQMIICGDPFQLPPVTQDAKKTCYFFQAKVWRQAFEDDCHFYLDRVFRQKDEEFLSMLRQVRNGKVTREVVAYFQGLERKITSLPPGIEPTTLYALNKDVDRINDEKIRRLPGEPVCFRSYDYFSKKSGSHVFRVPENLVLKLGAQVIILRNIEELGVVNGTRGVVTNLDVSELGGIGVLTSSGSEVVIKRFTFEIKNSKGAIVASRSQFPLCPGYATTIHKSQGQTLGCMVVDLSGAFAMGQAYVALTRAENPLHLQVLGFEKKVVIPPDEAVFEFARKFMNEGV